MPCRRINVHTLQHCCDYVSRVHAAGRSRVGSSWVEVRMWCRSWVRAHEALKQLKETVDARGAKPRPREREREAPLPSARREDERPRERDSGRPRERDSDRPRERDSERDRDRERDRTRERDRWVPLGGFILVS